MKISSYQMQIIPGDPDANRQKVAEWIKKVTEEEQPDIVVLPEMWTTSYTLSELKAISDQAGEPTTSFLQQLAQEYQINIVGGSFANIKNDKVYNSSVVINRKGDVVYRYDKVHLVPMLDEHLYLTGGETSHVFELEGIKMGLIICFDLRFPELSRSLALDGAEVLFVVAEWPDIRLNHWKHLQIARAIENQIYLVSVNNVGMHNGNRFGGTSMIVDPWGEVLASGGEEHEATITKEIDLNKVPQIRKEVPVFSCRVPSVYKLK